MISQNTPIGLQLGECPVCGDRGASIDHIKNCRSLRAADPSDIDEQHRMALGNDWSYSWPLVSFDRFADWRED